MKQTRSLTAICFAFCLTAAFCGCTSTRGESNVAEVQEVSSEAETETETVTTEATTEAVTESTTSATETTKLATETTAAEHTAEPAESNIKITHITEGGEGIGIFHQLSGNVIGEEMHAGSEYKSWKFQEGRGNADEHDNVKEAELTFAYALDGGFSVNGTVEVLPPDDPQYPNMMYFHSDDVDAFPKFMNDNRGEEKKAKFIIENSGAVYKMLDKDNPPAETAFSVSVTVSAVTIRYAADGSAYDSITVTAASNR